MLVPSGGRQTAVGGGGHGNGVAGRCGHAPAIVVVPDDGDGRHDGCIDGG
jgi:hypothetical protein